MDTCVCAFVTHLFKFSKKTKEREREVIKGKEHVIEGDRLRESKSVHRKECFRKLEKMEKGKMRRVFLVMVTVRNPASSISVEVVNIFS